LEAYRRKADERWGYRNGMHKYNNQDHAMVTALLTVETKKGDT
jgi:hypothetical protein